MPCKQQLLHPLNNQEQRLLKSHSHNSSHCADRRTPPHPTNPFRLLTASRRAWFLFQNFITGSRVTSVLSSWRLWSRTGPSTLQSRAFLPVRKFGEAVVRCQQFHLVDGNLIESHQAV